MAYKHDRGFLIISTVTYRQDGEDSHRSQDKVVMVADVAVTV